MMHTKEVDRPHYDKVYDSPRRNSSGGGPSVGNVKSAPFYQSPIFLIAMGILAALLLAGLGVGLYFLIKSLTSGSGSGPTPFDKLSSQALNNIKTLVSPDKLK